MLNLKKFDKQADYKKFKTETKSIILSLIWPNACIAKLNIKGFYCSVPILPEYQKLLKFNHSGILYKFTALSKGYNKGPKKFTRQQDIIVVGYFYYLINLADTEGSWIQNISKIINPLYSVLFAMHVEKTMFLRLQAIE